MDFLLTRGFTAQIQKTGGSEKILPRFDNANKVDFKVLEGHLMGVLKAQKNLVKIEIETKLKFKKERRIRHIYRVWDLIRYNQINLEKS